MLLSDAAAGEDEGYYCCLTDLLHCKKNNQRTQRDPPLLSASLFFETVEAEVSRLLQISVPPIAVDIGRPHSAILLPAEASFVSHEMEEELLK